MSFEDLSRLSGIAGLIYFGLIFAGVLLYALWPKNGQAFRDAASIPLRED